MRPGKDYKNRAATSFMEYTIILGVASAVLIGMNTYVKRGIQGRVKEMTDYFMSNQQVGEINPTVSQSQTSALVNTNSQGLIGGGAKLDLSETRNIKSSSRVEEKNFPFTDGTVTLPAVTLPEFTPAVRSQEGR